jgi:hypothetical protein
VDFKQAVINYQKNPETLEQQVSSICAEMTVKEIVRTANGL